MKKPIAFFPATTSGTEVLKVATVLSKTGTGRSNSVFLPALSTVSLRFTSTGSVQVISNSFDDSGRDLVIDTVTANKDVVINSASVITLNITANAGTIYASGLANGEIEE